MTCEVYEGDRVEIRVPYGLFRGTVNDFKKINHKEYSIKLVNIEILDESIATGSRSNDQEEEKQDTLSCHRFWHYEIQDLKIFKRHQSPEKVINQGPFNIQTIPFIKLGPSSRWPPHFICLKLRTILLNVKKQWTTDNDGEEIVPKVYKTRSDMSYKKANFEFIDNREKLAKILPIIMKMKEIAFLFEPSYPPGKTS